MPPNTDGQWMGAVAFNIPNPTVSDMDGHTFVDTRGLFVLHAVLLHTGKVLCFSGHVENVMYAPLCYLFDPDNATAQMSPIAFPPNTDLFCCHYAQLPDGRILAAGGSQMDSPDGSGGWIYRGSTGSKTIGIFDPDREQWIVNSTGGSPNMMQQGRWYGTVVALADGRLAIFSGRRELDANGNHVVPPPSIADMVEIFSPPDWKATELVGAAKALPIYPGLHLAPNGRIYYTHTTWGQEMANPDTASLQIPAGANSASWTVYSGLKPPHPRREEGMSVLLPPAQDGKILVIGGSHALNVDGIGVIEPAALAGPHGGPSNFDHIEDQTDPVQADILDTTTDPPTWSSVGQMSFGRINGHCVILPDATVLICGGHNKYKWSPTTTPSLTAEIFTPGTGFRTVDSMHDPRMYHSVALLLPDGRVFTAGGADPTHVPGEPQPPYPADWNGRTQGGAFLNTKTYEIYQPPYCFGGARPTITDVQRNGTTTRRIEYGQAFTITTPDAANIGRVVLMRPGAVTHHTDSDQRYVRMDFTAGTGQLNVNAISDRNLVPPGYYMVWIVTNDGLPCQRAVFIQMVPHGSSCFVATAALGSPDHHDVVYLQDLRRRLRDGSALGRRFIGTVTRVYESFSPRLARTIAADEDTRAAAREIVVRPVVSVIRASERLANRIAPARRRDHTLIALLAAQAVAGLAALPPLAAGVIGRTWLARRRRRGAAGAR